MSDSEGANNINVMNCRPLLAGKNKSSIISMLISILIGVKVAPVEELECKAVILEIFLVSLSESRMADYFCESSCKSITNKLLI
jgi:hypothetical protein